MPAVWTTVLQQSRWRDLLCGRHMHSVAKLSRRSQRDDALRLNTKTDRQTHLAWNNQTLSWVLNHQHLHFTACQSQGQNAENQICDYEVTSSSPGQSMNAEQTVSGTTYHCAPNLHHPYVFSAMICGLICSAVPFSQLSVVPVKWLVSLSDTLIISVTYLLTSELNFYLAFSWGLMPPLWSVVTVSQWQRFINVHYKTGFANNCKLNKSHVC